VRLDLIIVIIILIVMMSSNILDKPSENFQNPLLYLFNIRSRSIIREPTPYDTKFDPLSFNVMLLMQFFVRILHRTMSFLFLFHHVG